MSPPLPVPALIHCFMQAMELVVVYWK